MMFPKVVEVITFARQADDEVQHCENDTTDQQPNGTPIERMVLHQEDDKGYNGPYCANGIHKSADDMEDDEADHVFHGFIQQII